MTALVLVGDQALSEAEYAAYRRKRDRENARDRERRANDPEYRARENAYVREWKAKNLDRYRAYHRERARRLRSDPVQRERLNAYAREYAKRQRERANVNLCRYSVASLHDLRCTGPTRSTGCRCHKVTLYERVERAA